MSLQARIDFLLATHLPSQTRQLIEATDASLRRAYAIVFGADLLNPAGEFPAQQDPSFLSDVMQLKARQGGWGIRSHSDRIPFLNCLLSALPRIIGNGSTPPLWASLARTTGNSSVFDDENEPGKRWLETFFDSGSRMASEAQAEITRVRALRTAALASAGVQHPEESSLWDTPDEGFGYGLSKLQQLVFDDIKAYRLQGLIRRAKALLPNDQRRIAFLASHECKFSNSICSGIPLCSRRFSNELWATAVQSKLGAKLSCLAPFINRTLSSNMPSVDDNYVEPYGNNIKKLRGAKGGGALANHNSIVDVISDWLLKVHIPHMGGVRGRLKTCKDMFTHITQLLNPEDLDPAEQRVLQKIIPDLVPDFRALPETFEDIDMGPLAGFRPMVDVKTLACNGSYQGSNVNPVETRQSRAAAEYTRRAKDIDAKLGTPAGEEGPMTAEMKTYGSPPGQVLAPVVGAFGEMSSDMYALADVIAAAKTADHLQFFKGSAKEFRGMFRQQVIRDWGHAAHFGWARLLHDRRRELIARRPPSHQHEETEFYANHFYQNREQFTACH
jgi:hypothetical protein